MAVIQQRRTRPPRARERSRSLPFGRRPMPAGSAIVVLVAALLLGALLNIQSLRAAAERQAFGLKRDVALVLVWPLEQVSEILGLDEPRVLLDTELRRPFGGGGLDPDAAALPDGQAPALPRSATATAQGADSPDRRPERGFSAEDPLRVWVIGDSLTEQLGPAVRDQTAAVGVATSEHDFRYSSGLSRPDFFDWRARARALIGSDDPDAWVVMMGANDAQDVRGADGRFLPFASPEWTAVYRRRVGALMDELTAGGRRVVWVGQPIMRSAGFDERMAFLSQIYAEEAADRPGVAFLDARPLFAGEGGRYAAYLPDRQGQLVLARLGDGIHLTRAGADRLGAAVFDLLDRMWGLSTAEEPGGTQAAPDPQAPAAP